MMKTPLISIAGALLIAVLASCGPRYDIRTDDLKAAPAARLCQAAGEGKVRPEEVKAEIARRNLITAADMELMKTRTVAIGMSECALRMMLRPDDYDDEVAKNTVGQVIGTNYSASCGGVNGLLCPATRIEVRGGVVRAMVKQASR